MRARSSWEQHATLRGIAFEHHERRALTSFEQPTRGLRITDRASANLQQSITTAEPSPASW
jgi:hypothetical protein